MNAYQKNIYLNTLKRRRSDSLDADAYQDATLRALTPGKIYMLPDTSSTVKREYETGAIVGEIYSWTQKKEGLFWILKEGGYVLQAPGKFDPTLATNTSSKKVFEDRLKAADNGPLLDVSGFGEGFTDVMKYVMYAVIASLLFYLATKFIK